MIKPKRPAYNVILLSDSPTYTLMCICVYMYVYVYVYIYIYGCMYMYAYVYVGVCVFVNIYIYNYTMPVNMCLDKRRAHALMYNMFFSFEILMYTCLYFLIYTNLLYLQYFSFFALEHSLRKYSSIINQQYMKHSNYAKDKCQTSLLLNNAFKN